ncbi:HTH-type transcriptional activator IlvY [Actinocatenispora sera]|uniref:Transcriptional regulator IlvY n=1 Tax=Actinocatenispora sera TaxID=390989 RepID=A0A810KWZ8_9ACTN|nr:HTH-type transcriptional activator IlvY [Actinocatenispora sera]BCJ27760.1 transcriptional regulator IlvY [Actinocatenispora sera]
MDAHRDLRLYLHLGHTLNFGRTSAECHVSPATLTRVIQRLEVQAGERLLDRGPRGVALTAAGHRFQRYARDALRLWDEYREPAGDSDELTGRVTLFASVTACQTLLPDLLAPFRAAHPQVELELRTGAAAEAIARVDDGSVDLAVAALPDRIPASLISRPLTETPLVFVTALGPAAPRRITAGTPLVLPRSGLARTAADRWLRRRDSPPTRVSFVDSHEALLALVALGCGVGVVPRLVLSSSALADRLTEVPARPPLAPFRIGPCVRRDHLRTPLVAALWSTVTATAGPGR